MSALFFRPCVLLLCFQTILTSHMNHTRHVKPAMILHTTSMRNTIESPAEMNWPRTHGYFDDLLTTQAAKFEKEENEENCTPPVATNYKDIKTVVISTTASFVTIMMVLIAVAWSCEQERLDRELLDYLFQ